MEDLQGGTLALEHRYDLDRRVREFALVTAYRATQHPFERPVWVKVCAAPHEYSAPEVYERIKRALVEAAALRHPRIANIIDFGDIDTQLAFWVIERGEGTTLDEYLERHGTLAPKEALEIAVRVAEVVRDAHAAGLFHGGIAPRWVAIADEGVTVDHFAIQPTMPEIRQLDGVILSQDLLWSMPPESFADDGADHSAVGDVWGLGALLYWMLTGVHPYLDDPTDTAEAVLRLRNGAPAPTLDELGFDERLSEFVETALAADIDSRYASVEAFLSAAPLPRDADESADVELPTELPELPSPVGPRQGNVGTALAAALVLLVISNLGWFFVTTSQEPAHARQTLSAGAPEILPVGVQLNTLPAEAKIYRVDGSAEKEFGDTPLTLDPKALPEGTLPIIVRKHGHRDIRLDVNTITDGHEIVLHLSPDGEQAATK